MPGAQASIIDCVIRILALFAQAQPAEPNQIAAEHTGYTPRTYRVSEGMVSIHSPDEFDV